MLVAPSVATGRYIYSFANSKDATQIAQANLIGLNDTPVDVIQHEDLAVVVSPIADTKLRPQRKLLAAHQHVVTDIAKSWNSLPVAFGLIAESEQNVREVLARNAELLREQLERIQGRVEMFLSLKWASENIFQYFVEKFPELKKSRDYVASGAASREEQIELGRQFEQALSAERERCTAAVLENVSPVCQEIDIQPQRTENEILRVACLIERDKEDAFTQAVYQAASKFSDEYQFAFNGPWPPYSFVKLVLSMGA